MYTTLFGLQGIKSLIMVVLMPAFDSILLSNLEELNYLVNVNLYGQTDKHYITIFYMLNFSELLIFFINYDRYAYIHPRECFKN